MPIFESTDLVNWKQLGHVIDRRSQLEMDGLPVSSGVFAPDISYQNNVFYMIITNVGAGGNFFVTASAPAAPWSEPVGLPEIHGIEPSFFFDEDGRTYIVHNGEPPESKPLYDGHCAVWVWEYDMQSAVVKEAKLVVNGGTDLSKKPIWTEGPHIFKRNEFYYLNCAEGGTCEWHSQVIFRSESVWGPYVPFEENPMLTQRDLDAERVNPITSVGHADFVETTVGEWWAVFLGCRPYEDNFYNTGRETFLLPVSWVNDWPTILPLGVEVPRVVERPQLDSSNQKFEPQTGSFDWSDDFTGLALKKDWTFLRNPDEAWWNLDRSWHFANCASRCGIVLVEEKGCRCQSQSLVHRSLPAASRFQRDGESERY